MDILAAVTEAFTARSRAILGDNLAGVYLHGSAVMGCFNEKKSDIDLLTVVNGGVPDGVKRAYMDMVVGLNALAPQKGIEMSVVRRDVCKPFVYPTPFELHFSNGHLAWYEKDPADYIAKMNGVDWDLAAHFTVLRARGKRLFGEEIEDVFGEVEREYYIDSIWRDIEGAEEDIAEDPTYIALNLCRVLARVRDGLILSKREGGQWGLAHLPDRWHGLLRDALRAYESDGALQPDPDAATAFAAELLRDIKKEAAI